MTAAKNLTCLPKASSSSIQEFLITAADGKKYRTNHYWRGAKVRKEDVTIARNYLNAPELAALNNLVEQYLVFHGRAIAGISRRP